MRNSCFKALVLGLALAGCTLGLATQVQAQTNLLVPFTAKWRYNDLGASLDSVNWKTNTYNDSSWKPAGAGTAATGLFGYEGDSRPLYNEYGINTSLFRYENGASSGTQVRTYYFRGGFNFTGIPQHHYLVATNLVDDGVVVYLNGEELYRYNLPAGNITYTNLASNAAEGVYNIVVIPNAPMLRQGTNVLAVELHQTSTDSSDAVFGMSLGAAPLKNLVITKHPTPPTTVVTNIGARVTFSVEVTGSYPQYQWFKDGTNAISGANQASLTFPSVVAANTGTYTCVASNGLGKVTSTGVFLQALQDTFPPTPLFAVVREADTNRTITLSFNEDLLAPPSSHALYPISAVNPANYSLHLYNPNYAYGSSNAIAFGTSALLKQSVDGWPSIRIPVGTALNPNQTYVLKINTVADARQNRLTNWLVGVSFAYTTNLFKMDDVWDYTYMPQDATYAQGATNWTAINFQVDWDWGQGPGPMYFSQAGMDTCFGRYQNNSAPNGTQVSTWPDATFYFRNKFTVPQNVSTNISTIRLQHLVDDGVIFYLNGKELPSGRFNMPNGSASYGSSALSDIDVDCETNTMVVNNMLVNGENVIAAELHQWVEATGFDMFFGARMDLSVTTAPQTLTNKQDKLTLVTNAVAITSQPRNSTNTLNTTASFSVTATGDGPLGYQWLRNSNRITGATLATYNLPNVQYSDTNAFFNVVVSNILGSVTSAPVRVYVVQASGVPFINTQPQSRTNAVGTSASFSVTAIGNAPLAYQWRLSNTPIPGATSNSYTLPMVLMANNNSQFTVVVSNSLGSVTSVVATLTVTNLVGAPVIIVQPQSVTTGVGSNAQFSVVASGTLGLSYKWRLNGNVITGATSSSYPVSNVQPANNGNQYSVIVSNSFGSVTSQVATLTVTSVANTNTGLTIRYSTNSTGQKVAIVTWTNSSAKLLHCSNLTNASSFSDVPGSPSMNYTNVILPGANRFYKLVIP